MFPGCSQSRLSSMLQSQRVFFSCYFMVSELVSELSELLIHTEGPIPRSGSSGFQEEAFADGNRWNVRQPCRGKVVKSIDDVALLRIVELIDLITRIRGVP